VAVSLPTQPIPRDEVKIGNEAVLVRGLSRSEVTQLSKYAGDVDGAENFVVSCGVGISLEEAAQWRDEVDAEFAAPLIDRICELSGLAEGAQKSG
jgi:hypothetical protein